jgi:hypothetical protein
MGLFKSIGKNVLNYEFVYEEDFLIKILKGIFVKSLPALNKNFILMSSNRDIYLFQ